MSEHSLLSPSSAHRWLYCTGSVFLTKDAPRTSTLASAGGTWAHGIAEWALLNCRDPADYPHLVQEVDGFKFTLSAGVTDAVRQYCDSVRAAAAHGELHVEGSVDTSEVLGVPNQKGTSDAVILQYEAATIEVHDLKFGVSRVAAERNEQLMIYALAALRKYELLADWQKVKLVIHQPNIGASYNEWTISVAELELWGKGARYAAQQAAAAARGEAPPVYAPSNDACYWCPAKGSCRARIEQQMNEFPAVDVAVIPPTGRKRKEEIKLAKPDSITDEELGLWYGKLAALRATLDAIEAETKARAAVKGAMPGTKFVLGRKGNRAWKQEEAAQVRALLFTHLGDEAFVSIEPPVIGVPAAEELLMPHAWAEVQKYIHQEDAKPTLVPDSDKREAVTMNRTTAQDFPEVA